MACSYSSRCGCDYALPAFLETNDSGRTELCAGWWFRTSTGLRYERV
jgi:hypothetical protein